MLLPLSSGGSGRSRGQQQVCVYVCMYVCMYVFSVRVCVRGTVRRRLPPSPLPFLALFPLSFHPFPAFIPFSRFHFTLFPLSFHPFPAFISPFSRFHFTLFPLSFPFPAFISPFSRSHFTRSSPQGQEVPAIPAFHGGPSVAAAAAGEIEST